MAGLLGFALAGGMAGAGQGLVETAQQRREMFLENLRNERRQAERMQDREWAVEDRNLALASRSGGGGGGGAAARRTPTLSSGMQSRLERRFHDRTTNVVNWDNVDMAAGEMERLMAEQDVSETEAFRMATGAAVMETTEVQPGLLRRLTGAEPTTREGQNIVDFSYGGDRPAAPSPSPQATRPPAPSTGGDMPRPRTQAEYDALPSGATFMAPDGSVRVKP